jgi:hypothetical protein
MPAAGKATSYRRSSRRLLPGSPRRHAARLFWCVVALQGAVLVAMSVTSNWPRSGLTLLELLWAAAHKPLFYVLVALLVGGPALTLLAWRLSRDIRGWLVAAWVAFIAVMATQFHDETSLMLRVLWWAIQNR